MHPDPDLHLRLHRERTGRVGRPGRIHAVVAPRESWLRRLRRRATTLARAHGEAPPTTVAPTPSPTLAVAYVEGARDASAS